MKRPLLLLVLIALSLSPVPARGSDAGCTSAHPVVDRNAASYVCPGVRPGMLLRVTNDKRGEVVCGAGYAFVDQFGQRYLTFPGHCHLGGEGCLEDLIFDELPPPLRQIVHAVWPFCLLPVGSDREPVYKRNGPPVSDIDGNRIGAVAYAVNKEGISFGLVRLDGRVRLDPSVPLYGGPTKLGIPTDLAEVWAYSGNREEGVVNGRTGLMVARNVESPYVATEGYTTSRVQGTVVMTKNGEAVGFFPGRSMAALHPLQPLSTGLARATSRSGLRLRLMTAPLR